LKLFTVVLAVLISLSSFGHEYFFGFSEVEYNDISRKFECTIIVSTHDLELALENEGVETGDLAEISKGDQGFFNVQEYLNKHFKIWTTDLVNLNMVGSEVSLNGTTSFYFESDVIEIAPEIKVSFDLLMDIFKQQQNKITLTYRNNRYTRTFLYTERVQSIELENY
jgi:hypothetical protein